MAGLASMALGDAYVNILAETSYLQSGLLRSQAMVNAFVATAGSGITKGLIGAMIGIPTLVGGAMAYSVKSFMGAEVVSKRLAGAIAMAGGSVDTLMPKYEKLADKISRVTKWDDEAVKSSMASALARGLSTKKMEEAIPAATGLAARMGIDLATAMNMVTRAGLGNTMMLQRYFPQLKQATTATEKWAMVLKIGAAGMPLARSEINTISGAFGQMRKAVGEVFESFGQGLVGNGAFKTSLQGITDKIWGLKDSIDQFIASNKFQEWVDTAVGGIRYAISDISLGFGIITSVMQGLSAATKEAFISMGALANAFAIVSSEYGKSFLSRFKEDTNDLGDSLAYLFRDKSQPWNVPILDQRKRTTYEPDKNLIGEAWKTYIEGKLLPEKDATAITLDGIRAALDKWTASQSAISASLGLGGKPREELIVPGEKPSDFGTVSKASFSIISMSDQWKKMQEGITKNKDEKEIREATKKTASWTEQTAKGVATLINKFDEDDSSAPLFAAGY